MGLAVTAEAADRGADVTLVTTVEAVDTGATIIRVETAQEMWLRWPIFDLRRLRSRRSAGETGFR
jgi:phosphopantothenoylcysteine synthetase/decarboxylase